MFHFQACSEYYEFAQVHGKRWQRVLQFEHDQRLKLEEMVEQLAKDQVSLENKARKSLQNVKKDNPGNTPAEAPWGFLVRFLATSNLIRGEPVDQVLRLGDCVGGVSL